MARLESAPMLEQLYVVVGGAVLLLCAEKLLWFLGVVDENVYYIVTVAFLICSTAYIIKGVVDNFYAQYRVFLHSRKLFFSLSGAGAKRVSFISLYIFYHLAAPIFTAFVTFLLMTHLHEAVVEFLEDNKLRKLWGALGAVPFSIMIVTITCYEVKFLARRMHKKWVSDQSK